MKKKILALCLVVVLAVTAVTGATLAYFTDVSRTVTNTFTVGDVQIVLDEAQVNPDTGVMVNHDTRVLENTYNDIYPGQTLDKDPTVTIKANSEPSYVRMKVTVNVDALKAAFPKTVSEEEAAAGEPAYPELYAGDVFLLEGLIGGWDKAVWVPVETGIGTSGEVTYEFRYASVTEEKTSDYALKDLFTTVKIPAKATSADLKALVGEDGSFAFTIVAEAIQAAGFDNAEAAWNTFAGITSPQADPVEPTDAPAVEGN